MLKPIWHNKAYDFSIFRVVGGDLTPRDHPGARLEMMKFILDNEKDFPNTHKGWILNAVPDMDYRRKMEDLLHEYRAYFIVLPMFRKGYLSATSRDEKIVHAIPINKSRNLAINHGQKIAKFTVILDGDCFFDEGTWRKITSFIKRDQQTNNIQHYGIPHTRSFVDHVKVSSEPLNPLAEPMPVFRDDSPVRFDEELPFGRGDKLRLLFKLGYSEEPFMNHLLLHERTCKTVGYVHHLATGDESIETDLKKRVQIRDESINGLLHRLDTFVPPVRMPNTYWKQIHGWFDYQGLYSHLVFQSEAGSKFVEVGSWLGASTCYLATEAKNRQKPMQIYAVDTWEGTPEDQVHIDLIRRIGGPDGMYNQFVSHMQAGGVGEMITPMRMTSEEASKKFEDESVDFVFIDASHLYKDVKNDLKNWYPKVKRGGIIAGHDYVPGHPESDIGVVRAVNEFFNSGALEIGPAGRTWLHRKT